jgi:hypothetical protein
MSGYSNVRRSRMENRQSRAIAVQDMSFCRKVTCQPGSQRHREGLAYAEFGDWHETTQLVSPFCEQAFVKFMDDPTVWH